MLRVKKALGALITATSVLGVILFLQNTKTYAFSGPGDGSPETPFLIANCVQLGEIANDLDASYLLVNDIDCSESKNWGPAINDGYKGIDPIGRDENPFTGSLNGQGNTISGIYIDRVDDESGEGSDDETYVGLFGYIDGATIEALKLSNTRVRGYRYVGGLVGYATNSILRDIDVNLSVPNNSTCTSNEYCVWARWGQFGGGVVGSAVGGSTLTDLHTSGPVKGSGIDIGGIAGHIDTSFVSDSSSSSRVDGGIYAGGLVGSIWDSQVYDSFATGNVYAEQDDGSKPGSSAGGFAGSLYSVIVQDSYATGDVTGSNNIGGFAGISGCGSEVTSSYATGDVSGSDGVGGFVGSDECEGTGSTFTEVYTTGDVEGSQYIGGLIGSSSSSTINKSYSESNVSGWYFVGGLIGIANGSVSISESFYHLGAITADGSSVGGLIGQSDGTTNISNSYAKVNIIGQDELGGLVGFAGEGEGTIIYIEDSYAVGSINSSGWQIGGIVGSIGAGNVTKVFSAVSINSTNLTTGGLYGANSNATVDGYVDETQAGCGGVIAAEGSGTQDCTPVNSEGSDPAYFKYTNLNPPLNQWDFDTKWATASNDYPCLNWSSVSCGLTQTDSDGDGMPNSIEEDGPNNGDANDDNIPDAVQPNVVSYLNIVTNNYSVLTTNCTSITGVYNGAEPDDPADTEYDYPGGLTSFRIVCPHDGDTATIMQYYYGIEGNENFTVRKWINGQYVTIEGARPLGQPIGDQVVFLLDYQITDGGEYDDDGEVNGVIVDPSGAAVPTSQDSQGSSTSNVSQSTSNLANTGSNSKGIITTITALLALSLSSATVILKRKVNI